MTHTTHAAEATLIYSAFPNPDEPALVRALSACLRRRADGSAEPRVDHRAATWIHLTQGSVDVLVSLCPLRLPPENFARARRPKRRLRANGHVQSLLEFHETCVTVLVTTRSDGPTPVPRSRVEALAEAISHRIARLTGPDLVFMAATGTLYAQEEFARRDAAFQAAPPDRARPVRPARTRDAHLRGAPRIPRQAALWFAYGTVPDPAAARKPPEPLIGAARDPAAPPPQDLSDTLAGNVAIYLMTATLMLLSFPIGFALLIYNVMSGGSYVATARAIALTGIFSAAASTGLPERALALL